MAVPAPFSGDESVNQQTSSKKYIALIGTSDTYAAEYA